MLVNLVVNARDAMPAGGRLAIETSNVERLEPAAGEHDDVPNGGWVCLAVSDTGIGMNSDVQTHLFEPFFTTKERGRGTGLGLATVYGIVTQSGGTIRVDSEPGRGTTFRIYLPRARGVIPEGATAAPVAGVPGGRETILLVEDEELVRNLQQRVLERRGYRVLTARHAQEAQAHIATEGDSVDLLVTDVVLPGINGRQLADRLSAAYPALKVLFVSGYAEDAIVNAGVLDPEINFLSKPFSPDALAREVRRILDQPPIRLGSCG